jgi:hypothetical protein
MDEPATSWSGSDRTPLRAADSSTPAARDHATHDETVAVLPPMVPRWLAPLLGVLALLLIPWIIYLGYSLPPHTVSRHYNVSWVGFDLLLLLVLSCTAILAYRGMRQVQFPAIITATLLVVDAWFDVTTAHRGLPMLKSLLLAVFVELPLAAVCLYVARRVQRLTSDHGP